MNLKKGHLAEEKVIKFLLNKGFEILARNYYSRYGEIDIVAKLNNVFHFIEVKSGRFFNPAENFTDKKMSRLLETIYIYLNEQNINSEENNYVIDLATVRDNIVELYENISF